MNGNCVVICVQCIISGISYSVHLKKKTIFLFILASSMIPKIFSVYPTATYIPVYNVFHLLEFFYKFKPLYRYLYIYFFL